MQLWGRYTFVPTSKPDRFLMIKPAEDTAPNTTDIVVVDNWPAEFEKTTARR